MKKKKALPPLKDPHKELLKLLRIAKSLISLGHYKTVEKTLDSVSAADYLNVCPFDKSHVIDNFDDFKELETWILQEYERRTNTNTINTEKVRDTSRLSEATEQAQIRLDKQTSAKEQEEISYEEIYKTQSEDSLIETSLDDFQCADRLINRPSIEEQANELQGSKVSSKETPKDRIIPPHNPLQKAKLFTSQRRAAEELYHKLITEDKSALLLRGGGGSGKTFVLGQVFRWLVDSNYHVGKSYAPWKYLYVTKASIVIQTQRVLENHFGLDCVNMVKVTNYDQLRAFLGEMLLGEKEVMKHGEYVKEVFWKEGLEPIVVIWDECQSLMNTDSQQSVIGQKYNELTNPYLKQIYASATPGTKVAHFMCFVVATKVPYTFGIAKDAPMTNNHWTSFASYIAAPFSPEEHHESSMERMMDYMKDYVVDIKNIRPQFHAHNSVKFIDFANEADRKKYNDAWLKYLEDRAKIEGKNVPHEGLLILAMLNTFSQASELIRAPYLAEAAHASVMAGKAAVIAVRFKATLAKIVLTLHQKYGVPRSQISLIWGGYEAYSGKENKYSKQDIQDALMKCARGIEVDKKVIKEITAQLKRDANGLGSIPDGLNLGIQSKEQRQKEIDRFQSGKSLYCGFTFKAGGVGLSLHHTDELTKFKCRRKESGYVYEEDIPLVPTRPREAFLGFVYSAIELVQGVCRAPRLTSLSDTNQVILAYKGTVEEQMGHIVSMKLRCLRKVVRQKESWEDCILGGDKLKEAESKAARDIREIEERASSGKDNEDDNEIIDIESEEENEN